MNNLIGDLGFLIASPVRAKLSCVDFCPEVSGLDLSQRRKDAKGLNVMEILFGKS
jgi:hypothetical protein